MATPNEAVRVTIWQRTLDSDRDWRAFESMAMILVPLRQLLRIALGVLSGSTIAVMLVSQSKVIQATCAIATAVIASLLEFALTEALVERVRSGANFEARAYREWFALWRRNETVTLDEVSALEARHFQEADRFRGLTPTFVLDRAAKRTDQVQRPILIRAEGGEA